MTQWPPEVKHDEPTVRTLRAWRFTRDGPFWGAVMTILVWFSVCGYIVILVVEEG